MIKLLTFSSLFPNPVIPHHGVFVENRLRKLIESGEVVSQVVAPVPWFPVNLPMFEEYSKFARVPAKDTREGIKVFYPKYLVVPKIGMNWTPDTMAKAALPVIQDIINSGYDFDILDAHYFYPDGVAAAKIAEKLNKPFTVTARGTDLNLIPQYPKPKAMIQQLAKDANHMITVCQALKDTLVELGAENSKVTALRNGVDLDLFQPLEDRDAARKKLRIEGKTILSVGHLIERKGHHLVIEAMQYLPDVKLLIAGQGAELKQLENLSRQKNISDRITFLGSVPHDTLKEYYGAVDMLVLASSREGWANVLLESMACGTPVVATNIWGTPEVVASDEAGVLIERTPDAVADGVRELYEKFPNRCLTRKYAEKFSWDDTTRGQLKIFNQILGRRAE